MRVDSIPFRSANNSEVAAPVVVVEVSFATDNSELFYLTSHAGVSVPDGADVYQNCIMAISSTSQKLNISAFSSTIGAINITAVDNGTLTDYFRTQLAAGNTPSKNRLRVYVGFQGMDFDDFSLVQTQIVKNAVYDNGKMTVNCLDIQRETKKTIFDPKITILTANVNSSATTFSVQNTNEFEMLYHGPSYTDAPSTTVGYLRLKDSEKSEVIRYTGKTGTTFTGVTRGVHGTIAQDWQAVDGDGQSRDLEVEEFIYLELPAVKLIYAILTGNLYGDAGKYLPDHWHLGIDTQWVSTSKFTTLGNDIWDVNDDAVGKICYFSGVKDQAGRDFINKELLPLVGCYMPISAAGELGISRITSIISSSTYKVLLNESNIKSMSGVRYAMDEVINKVQVDWTYDFVDENFRRTSLFYDTGSSAIYGLRPEKVVELKGMYGTRHSRDFIRGLFNSLRDRFGGEPLYCRAELQPMLNVLEVGDTVRLDLANWEDYTSTASLDRTFEVQGVTIDWLKGNVSVDLFGSSRKAGELPDDGDGYTGGSAIDDGILTGEGTNIEVAFPSQTSRVGDLVTLNSDITFNGNNSLIESDGTPNPGCILYCTGDLVIATGVTLTISKNVILTAAGFLTVNGTINGAGRGYAGGDYRRTYVNQTYQQYILSGAPPSGVAYTNENASYPAPTSGYMHTPLTAQRGIMLENSTAMSFMYNGDTFNANSNAFVVNPRNNFPIVPEIDLKTSNLFGLPSDLQGGSGPCGGHLFMLDFLFTATPLAPGTNGGNGGAGLVTITRGMEFGAAGKINLSGGNAGSVPGSTVMRGETFYAGVGCGGAPGSWYCFIDGGDSVAPIVTQTKYLAKYGTGASYGQLANFGFYRWGFTRPNQYEPIPIDNIASGTVGTTQYAGGVNQYAVNHRVQFLVPSEPTPGVETPASAAAPNVTGFTLSESVNTPATPAGDKSSIEISVTPPVSPNYAYARAYHRLSGAAAWTQITIPAEPETVFIVPSDGATHEVQVRSVSITGVENPSGPIDTITTTVQTVSADYYLDFGYDQPTNSFLRVIETSSGDIVSYIDKDGYSGNITGGTVGPEVVIPGVERSTFSVNPTTSTSGLVSNYIFRNGGGYFSAYQEMMVAAYLPSSAPANSDNHVAYPVYMNDTGINIDFPAPGDYRELRFGKILGPRSGTSPTSTYFSYSHGRMDANAGGIRITGMGIYFDPTVQRWYLYAQDGDQTSTPKRLHIPELFTASGQIIRIVYNGSVASGGTGVVTLYIDGVESGELTGVTGLPMPIYSYVYGMFSACTTTADAYPYDAPSWQIVTSNFKFFSSNPVDIFGA